MAGQRGPQLPGAVQRHRWLQPPLGSAGACPAQCKTWNDGCNDCVCAAGRVGVCDFNPDCGPGGRKHCVEFFKGSTGAAQQAAEAAATGGAPLGGAGSAVDAAVDAEYDKLEAALHSRAHKGLSKTPSMHP